MTATLLSLALALLAGCGGSSGGPQRYAVSGTVTFDGKPVPKGSITLEPNAESGNSGPGGGAEIVDGKYNTGVEKGVIGGAYKIRIVGYDGVPVEMEGEKLADGKSLFSPYETTFDFPQETTTKDFEIPK
jgi:hypothetical protein